MGDAGHRHPDEPSRVLAADRLLRAEDRLARALARARRLADDAAAAAQEYRAIAAEFLDATAGLDESSCEALYCGTDLCLLGSVLLHAGWSITEAVGSEPEPLGADERLELRWRFDWEPAPPPG